MIEIVCPSSGGQKAKVKVSAELEGEAVQAALLASSDTLFLVHFTLISAFTFT